MKDQTAARTAAKKPVAAFDKDADTRALEADLSANLKMDVRIDHAAGGESGEIVIRYNSLDDLDMLCNLLSGLQDRG